MTTSDSGPPQPPKGIAGTIDGGMESCGSCGRPVTPRALFCHSCGAVQPPHPLDPFTRLGLERRFDLEPEALNRQHAGFSRALDPQRFAARGRLQQANARAQAAALSDAYETLRDPLRRARCLLDLEGKSSSPGAEPLSTTDAEDDEEVAALAQRLTAASDTVVIDRLAAEIGQRVESCIKYLAIAFRNGQTDNAARILARLEQLEALCAEARDRRAGLVPPAP